MGPGSVLTSQTKGRARNESTKGVIPVVVLFAQVGRGAAGELVGGAGDGWEGGTGQQNMRQSTHMEAGTYRRSRQCRRAW